MVLLGNTAVGKTSIFNRGINDAYIEDGVSSTSAYFRSKMIKVPGYNATLKMNLWDTAGQERFQSLTKMYTQDAVGVILVYDMTYAESLDGVLQWYKLVQENLEMDNVVVALVGNKCDNVEQQAVSNKAAIRIKDQINAAIWLEVSAKTGLNVPQLFD